jgi:YVTN family beta-propeller protein
MKQLKLNYFFISAGLCLTLASCHKDNNSPVNTTPVSTGLFVLNQGGFQGNNSTLSVYDYATKAVVADKFSAVNGRGLGDTGNDIETYGSKTYIVVNVSSNLEVINTKTAKSIVKIPFFTNTTARQPRNIVFYKGNAFVSVYDGKVDVIDTNSLAVTKSIAVGANPEQMAISNGKLYVANSGGLQLTFSNTVSVIDLGTLTVIKTVTVGTNPLAVAADAYGEVYVTAQGDYLPQGVQPSITVINTATDVAAAPVTTSLSYGSPFVISGDFAYYVAGDNKIKVYNVKTKTLTSASFITDNTAVQIPYAITVDDASGEVFVGDAVNYSSNGNVYAFDKNGKLEYSFKVGINPGKITIIKN